MFIESNYLKWQCDETESLKIFLNGFVNANEIKKINFSDEENISNFLKNNKEYSSAVIETDTKIIAWVDHIRSWPLFYTVQDEQFYISPLASNIKDKIKNDSVNQDALTEFKLSGYVTGPETLINKALSLQPGEFLIWDKMARTLRTKKYYSYIPTFDRDVDSDHAIKELNTLFDKLTKKMIERSNNRTIIVPLSGGLDSRILLCKLHEHGYQNIQTFTYGPRFNFEGLIAKNIAKKLNIPWKFIAPPKKTLRQYFDSNGRKDFWNFACNWKSIPCMREYGAIRYLHETNQIPKDAIFLNGQSGDYISGAHLSPQTAKETYTKEDFYNVIINKHYDLWKQHKTKENMDFIKNRIDEFLLSIFEKKRPLNTPIDGGIYEETWEYDGRQICYVVNGQRVYEYFGYDWEMPLWEKEYVDFFHPLPFKMKYGQQLYKDYLKQYNYEGLFPTKEPYIWRWPVPMLWVVPLAQIVGLCGRKAKDKFYAVMRYWGHYANQYAFFDFKYHVKTAQNARNIIALYVPKFLKENNLDFD